MKRYFIALALVSFASNSFAQLLLSDSFSYANGALVGAPGSTWVNHSGTAGTLLVNNQTVYINQPGTTGGQEDANALLMLGGNPVTFAPDGDGDNNDNLLYSAFTIRYTTLPNDILGSYFGHFKSSTANEFYGRLGGSLSNAAPGNFRLSIGNEAWNTTTIAQYPQDLNLGVTYNLVTRHNVDTGATTLWVDPVSEGSTSVTAADPRSFAGAINAYALRQGTTGTPAGAPGELFVDNLLVGQTFADVVPVPEPGTISLLALGALLLGFKLRRK